MFITSFDEANCTQFSDASFHFQDNEDPSDVSLKKVE